MRFFKPLVLAALLATTAHAWAHAVLVESQPAPRAHVPGGRRAIRLRYNSRIDAGRSLLTLRHGALITRLVTRPGDGPDVLISEADVTPGEWVIKWQVLATDGHVTRGTVPFTVDGTP